MDALDIMLSEAGQAPETTCFKMFRMWKFVETKQISGGQVLGEGRGSDGSDC